MKKKLKPPAAELNHITAALRPMAVAIGTLKADPDNVNTHDARSVESIAASLQRFGQQAPVLIVPGPAGKKIVKKGNGVLAAAKSLGWKHLAAVESDLSGDAAKAYAIADNQLGKLSQFDEALLAQQLAEFNDTMPDLDVESLGFSDAELESLGLPAALADPEGGATGASRQGGDTGEPPAPVVYKVVAECRNPTQQKKLFNRLRKDGFRCKLVTA